jgi:hypothetical protein
MDRGQDKAPGLHHPLLRARGYMWRWGLVFHRTDRADRRARDSSPRRPGGVGVGLHGVGSGTHGSNTSLLASVTKKLPSKPPETMILLLLAMNASDGNERTAFILAEVVPAVGGRIVQVGAAGSESSQGLPLKAARLKALRANAPLVE